MMNRSVLLARRVVPLAVMASLALSACNSDGDSDDQTPAPVDDTSFTAPATPDDGSDDDEDDGQNDGQNDDQNDDQ